MSLGSRQLISPGSRTAFDCYSACDDEVQYDERRQAVPNDSGLGITGVVTAMFGIEFPPETVIDGTTDISGIFIQGYVQTGRNDNQRFEFDLINGTMITVPARIFAPTAVYPVIPLANQPSFYVNFSIGKGTRGSADGNQPRRTLTANIPLGGASPVILIPPFAESAIFESPDGTLVTVDLIQRTGFNGQIISQAPMGRTEDTAVSVAAGAQSFQIINPLPAPLADTLVRVVWRLAF